MKKLLIRCPKSRYTVLIDERIRTCAELCAAKKFCDKFTLKNEQDENFANMLLQHSLMISNAEHHFKICHRENISLVCTENVPNRYYHSDDEVLCVRTWNTWISPQSNAPNVRTIVSHFLILVVAPQDRKCGQNQVNPKDPFGYILTPEQAKCRNCLSAQRRISNEDYECGPCPEAHVQSSSSEFWCHGHATQ